MMRNTWIASLGLIPVTFFQAMRAGVVREYCQLTKIVTYSM
jgi:hypothetical protein